jgi:hypothetical protein
MITDKKGLDRNSSLFLCLGVLTHNEEGWSVSGREAWIIGFPWSSADSDPPLYGLLLCLQSTGKGGEYCGTIGPVKR